MNNKLSEILTPVVITTLERLQDSGPCMIQSLAYLRSCIIDLSYYNTEHNFMQHLRDMQQIEELIADLTGSRDMLNNYTLD